MGVPSFYRWLADKYPKIEVNAVEEHGGASNPKKLEFDNLYLDMNGIIHPCFHPQDCDFQPVTFDEVFGNIFDYIDRIFRIIRPRKLLYMAIDGVAPRAKMNQQRARRYRTAKDNEIAAEEEQRLRRQFQMEGKDLVPKVESEVSDSNVITPGTEFMFKLSKELQSYIRLRLDNDPGWKEIKVILSDANVPGEGEHKIMSFIRLQRTFPDYNPNTRHCLYGLDADLIMLALATHELHFSILREDVLAQERSSVISRGLCEQVSKESNKERSCSEICSSNSKKTLTKKPYQFLHVWVLREYLELDMKFPNPPEGFVADIERIIDDFIFICLFAGNDFLPHMPTLEIHEGGIDLLMQVYKEEFNNLGGYLTDMKMVDDKKGGFISVKRVEKFILRVGSYEDAIFSKRSELRERRLRRVLADCANSHEEEESTEVISDVSLSSAESLPATDNEILQNTIELKEKLKTYIRETSDLFTNGLTKDTVRLGVAGWKERYYKVKFSAESPEEIQNTRKKVVEKYTEGLCWVLLYYYSGVPSWTWFYPFHCGPFASDLKGLSQIKLSFQLGLPFKPFDQLMAVLPPKSAHALPPAFQSLMLDENSAIIDFYPDDFEVDTDGKRFLWQGICKLPFIIEELLLKETKKLDEELTEEEYLRNAASLDRLFMQPSSALGSKVISLYENHSTTNQHDSIKIESGFSDGINGFMFLESDGDGFSEQKNALSVFYKPPPFCKHSPLLLPGVTEPDERTVHESDIKETQLWHEHRGSRQCYRFVTTKPKPSRTSKNVCPEVVIKGAGSGWTPAGQGRGRIHDIPPSSQTEWERRPLPCSSSMDSSSSRWNVHHDVCDHNAQNVHRGIENLRISDPAKRSNSYGRAYATIPLRPSGRAYALSENAWMQRTSPPGLHSYQNSRPFSSSPGQPTYNMNSWQNNNYQGPPGRSFNNSTSSSPGQPTYNMNSWQNNNYQRPPGRSFNNSTQGRGRGSYVGHQAGRGWNSGHSAMRPTGDDRRW